MKNMLKSSAVCDEKVKKDFRFLSEEFFLGKWFSRQVFQSKILIKFWPVLFHFFGRSVCNEFQNEIRNIEWDPKTRFSRQFNGVFLKNLRNFVTRKVGGPKI